MELVSMGSAGGELLTGVLVEYEVLSGEGGKHDSFLNCAFIRLHFPPKMRFLNSYIIVLNGVYFSTVQNHRVPLTE